MSFLTPERLIWLWVAIPVIGFYILKARLRRRKVSTLLFWDQIFEEKRQRSLWQNLRHWLSLLLQLIFIALLVFALTDPMSSWQQKSGQELILIIDNSASMQTTDSETGKSRLELAKEEAVQLAQGLRAGDSAAVMTAGNRIQVVSGMTDFGPTVREAVETIRVTEGPTKIEEAIIAARRLSTDAERRRIVVISDACGQFESDDLSAEGQAEVASSEASGNNADDQPEEASPDRDVYWMQVGSDAGNTAITMFQARRSTVDPLGYALLVQIQNFSDEDVKGRLKLELDGVLVDVVPFELGPDEVDRRTIRSTSQTGGILVGTLDSEDGLAVDNVARAVVPKRPTLPVTLVAQGDDDNYYLKNVLNSVPLLELTEIGLDEYNSQEDADAVGLTVFSGAVPKKLPDGPVLFVAPTADGPTVEAANGEAPAWTLGPELESALVAKQEDAAALLMHVKMQNVLVMGARDIQMAEDWQPSTSLLQTAESANVLVSVEREAGRILILAANLDSSDLPLRIAFPVMMTNAVNWFLRQSNEIHPALRTGVESRIVWDQSELDDNQELNLITPRSRVLPVGVHDKNVVADALGQTGVYCLTAADNPMLDSLKKLSDLNVADDDQPISGAGVDPEEMLTPEAIHEALTGESQLVAVNLCSAEESDLRLPELPDQSDREIPASGWPPWLWAILIASGFIVLEWGLFHRRVVA